MLQRSAYRGTHTARGAAADGIDYHHGRARLIWDRLVNFRRCAQLLYTEASQLFAHRDHHKLWIHFFSSPPTLL